MARNKQRFWRFSCGHIGGEIQMARMGSGRMRILLLYEQSQKTRPGCRPALRGRLLGTMYDIRCTICGCIRDWVIGDDALQELLERRKSRLKSLKSTSGVL